jgi:hypothetical protein
MDLRTQDKINEMIEAHVAKNEVDISGWRVKWRGRFVVMRSGVSLWPTKGKASSGFQSSVRNDWHFLWEYMKIKSNDPKFDWNKIRDLTLQREVIKEIMDSGDVEFIEIQQQVA